MPEVVTANRLRTGAVVYLRLDKQWATSLDEATVAETAGDLEQLEAVAGEAVARNEVTAVYAFPVRIENGRPIPISVRERIRAAHAATV